MHKLITLVLPLLLSSGLTVSAHEPPCLTSTRTRTLPTASLTTLGTTTVWTGQPITEGHRTTTVYTTEYEEFCSTGLRMHTYTLTEYCPPQPDCPCRSGIPKDFYTTVTVCNNCGKAPITATLTLPHPTPVPTHAHGDHGSNVHANNGHENNDHGNDGHIIGYQNVDHSNNDHGSNSHGDKGHDNSNHGSNIHSIDGHNHGDHGNNVQGSSGHGADNHAQDGHAEKYHDNDETSSDHGHGDHADGSGHANNGDQTRNKGDAGHDDNANNEHGSNGHENGDSASASHENSGYDQNNNTHDYSGDKHAIDHTNSDHVNNGYTNDKSVSNEQDSGNGSNGHECATCKAAAHDTPNIKVPNPSAPGGQSCGKDGDGPCPDSDAGAFADSDSTQHSGSAGINNPNASPHGGDGSQNTAGFASSSASSPGQDTHGSFEGGHDKAAEGSHFDTSDSTNNNSGSHDTDSSPHKDAQSDKTADAGSSPAKDAHTSDASNSSSDQGAHSDETGATDGSSAKDAHSDKTDGSNDNPLNDSHPNKTSNGTAVPEDKSPYSHVTNVFETSSPSGQPDCPGCLSRGAPSHPHASPVPHTDGVPPNPSEPAHVPASAGTRIFGSSILALCAAAAALSLVF
ncbi:hypothetical protein S7711_04870 [Stachybotrys chartarum IBT 7711]|uniref:Uncharacterized protein n=1 Tax=Stachybotrys chartarum (strain CBS 109288 / IBT 7711) TaxID=1280523 RepID=A0A084B6E1_STACB|nr:hypothetical protein S7711_04870 [Stachybotrys chartarum IBT 7711]